MHYTVSGTRRYSADLPHTAPSQTAQTSGRVIIYLIFLTSKRYSVGARLSGRSTDGLYVLLCRYIRSQATHRYISRSAASYEEPISSYSLELK